jgi:hypothetical protein
MSIEVVRWVPANRVRTYAFRLGDHSVNRLFAHFAHEFGIFMDLSPHDTFESSHDICANVAGANPFAADKTVSSDDLFVGDLVSCACNHFSMSL